MKIAMVSEHASPLAALGGVDAGGQNVHVAALSAALAASGHLVTVYTRRDDPDSPDRVRMAPGVIVEHLRAGPPRPIPKDEIFPYVEAMAARLASAWDRERPDVVHAHFWMSGLAALRAARPAGIPVVQTFHALGSVKRRHQGAHDTSPPARVACERYIANRADRILATCTDELFELCRLGAEHSRVSVVPCGVDTELFTPGPAGAGRPVTGGPAACPHRIVSIGRLVERKGIDDVIRAMPAMPGTGLVIAGGPDAGDLGRDPDALRLANLARRTGVEDRVELIGRLGRDQVPGLLRSADLAVCVPWYEPFGIVPLEAMACAVPVVASTVGGLVDTVVDGRTGVHVPPRDPAALARAVRRLLADPGRRSAMGRAGRRRVVERYRWDRVADSTVEAYKRATREGTAEKVAL